MDVNSSAAGSELEACMRPITYFIAAKFIAYSAAASLCIQTKRCVTRQSEANLAASSPCCELAACVSKDNGGTTGVQVDLALEMLALDAPSVGAQIDQTLQVIGFDAPSVCFHRDLPLKIVRVYAAATSAHTNHPACALKRDSSRAIMQLYIATGRHSDLEIDSAQ